MSGHRLPFIEGVSTVPEECLSAHSYALLKLLGIKNVTDGIVGKPNTEATQKKVVEDLVVSITRTIPANIDRIDCTVTFGETVNVEVNR